MRVRGGAGRRRRRRPHARWRIFLRRPRERAGARRRSGWRSTGTAVVRGLGILDDGTFERTLTPRFGGELKRRLDSARAIAGARTCSARRDKNTPRNRRLPRVARQKLMNIEAAIVGYEHDRGFLEGCRNVRPELEGGRGRLSRGQWHAWRKERPARVRSRSTCDRSASRRRSSA